MAHGEDLDPPRMINPPEIWAAKQWVHPTQQKTRTKVDAILRKIGVQDGDRYHPFGTIKGGGFATLCFLSGIGFDPAPGLRYTL